MTNKEHLKLLLQCAGDNVNGSRIWNDWRKNNDIHPNQFIGADFGGLILAKFDLSKINFSHSNFEDSILIEASFESSILDEAVFTNSKLGMTDFIKVSARGTNFSNSNLVMARFVESNCEGAIFQNASMPNSILINCNFSNADFREAILISANLANSKLIRSDMRRSVLSGTNLTGSDLSNANITGAIVYGISAWNIETSELNQDGLIITHSYENPITVDDIEVAQFIYLLSHNKKLANVIDTITSKVVLILGRFTQQRKLALDVLKDQLRNRGFVSVVFDFEKPESRDLTETIGLIGRMSKFVVADITDAKSIPQELAELIPNNPSIIVVPIIEKGNSSYSMFEHWESYPWVMAIQTYSSVDQLKTEIDKLIIDPVNQYIKDKTSK